jgi:adenylate cyclase
MSGKYRILFTESLFIILYWLVVFYLYYIYVFWGYRQFMLDNVMTKYANSAYVHVEIIIQSTLFALAFIIINTLSDKTFIRRRPLGQIILFKSILYLLAMVLTEHFVVSLFDLIGIAKLKDYKQYMEIATPGLFFSFFTYFLVSVLFISFFLQMNRKIGPGNMFRLLIGRYHKPREEKRIFMFLDLKGSTTIAESIGHKAYSQLLRSCFHDLTDIILQYGAEIYQFVGDEVVLTWTEKDGLKNLNCLNTFFSFEQILEKRKNFYQKNFQVYPRFRAGMDLGLITVAEIGDIKREIAFHGDVLNTAARLQGICKNYDSKLLISEHLANAIESFNGFKKESLGAIRLRGKKEVLKVYRIEKLDQA